MDELLGLIYEQDALTLNSINTHFDASTTESF